MEGKKAFFEIEALAERLGLNPARPLTNEEALEIILHAKQKVENLLFHKDATVVQDLIGKAFRQLTKAEGLVRMGTPSVGSRIAFTALSEFMAKARDVFPKEGPG